MSAKRNMETPIAEDLAALAKMIEYSRAEARYQKLPLTSAALDYAATRLAEETTGRDAMTAVAASANGQRIN